LEPESRPPPTPNHSGQSYTANRKSADCPGRCHRHTWTERHDPALRSAHRTLRARHWLSPPSNGPWQTGPHRISSFFQHNTTTTEPAAPTITTMHSPGDLGRRHPRFRFRGCRRPQVRRTPPVNRAVLTAHDPHRIGEHFRHIGPPHLLACQFEILGQQTIRGPRQQVSRAIERRDRRQKTHSWCHAVRHAGSPEPAMTPARRYVSSTIPHLPATVAENISCFVVRFKALSDGSAPRW
jgi:hypothetical protein